MFEGNEDACHQRRLHEAEIGLQRAADARREAAALSHEDSDAFAQRVLGNIEPYPGESYADYTARAERADAAFAAAHPNWRK